MKTVQISQLHADRRSAPPLEIDSSYTRIRRELAKYAVPRTIRGVTEFTVDLGVIAVFFCAVLFLPELWMKLAASILLGFRQAIIMVIAHDAAHGNTTSSTALNKCIAVIGFLPSLFNYRLWIYDHNQTHHVRTNDDHLDLYKPFSKTEFDKLPGWRRCLEKIYRTPLGLFLYYPTQRFLQYKLFPNGNFPHSIHKSAWRHFILIATYVIVISTNLVYLAPTIAPITATQGLLLGLVVPFFVSTTTFTFTTYLQHTHPDVPWFDSNFDRRVIRQEDITPDIVMPDWYNFLSHHIHEHTAHHVNSKIPYYNAHVAQRRVIEMMGPEAVVSRFSLRWFLHCMRTCRLYDYEKHQWVDWDGTALTGCLIKPHIAKRMQHQNKPRLEAEYALAS